MGACGSLQALRFAGGVDPVKKCEKDLLSGATSICPFWLRYEEEAEARAAEAAAAAAKGQAGAKQNAKEDAEEDVKHAPEREDD